MDDPIKVSGDRTVIGFVQRRLPDHHRGVIPVPADHLACILAGALFEYVVSDKLPARIRDNGEDAQLVARVHKTGVLWIVASIGGEAGFAQFVSVAIVRGGWQRIAHVRMVLMPISAYREERLAVDQQSAIFFKSN